MLKCFTILKPGFLSPWWTLPLNSTWCVCSAPRAQKAAELIGFTSRQCVCFHQLRPRCISTPSHLRQSGAVRCRCIRHLCLPGAGAQHSNSTQSRYAGQKDRRRNKIKHLVNLQKLKQKCVECMTPTEHFNGWSQALTTQVRGFSEPSWHPVDKMDEGRLIKKVQRR